MDKTININLGGTLFHIDEEAYRILRDYLQAISRKFQNVPGGNETIDDIESRIAEIFLSQKSTAGVINRINVEDMIYIIGKPEDFDQTEDERPAPLFGSTYGKKLFRNPDDRIIGGICGGIGTYLNTDPVWFRILFVLFALMFGIGLFVYLALWIALPSAETESLKKDMYGKSYIHAAASGREAKSYTATTDFGNAMNEIFRAIGKILWIIVRIFLILIGVSIVVAGFLAIISFIMVFIFRLPGAFSTDAAGMNISYMPDFLNYVVTPSLAPWIKVLVTISVILPLIVIIYLGVKMIFWFRARDGVFLLTGFVIWVLSVAALSILLFNEGLNYTENARSVSQEYFKSVPDTVYVKSGAKISDLNIDNEILLPAGEYSIFVTEGNRRVYILPDLDIAPADRNSAWVEVNKRSAGRSKMDAGKKADRLQYNFYISGDTLFVDEYFTIPEGTKWSFDMVHIDLLVPEGTVIYMDRTVENLVKSYYDDDFITDQRNTLWRMEEYGLEYIEPGRKFNR
jgi:phage shock protein PspC (stress-responsive transcriptional regulator)